MKSLLKDKKVLVSVLGILGIILTTVGVTYAFFSYSKTGTKLNTIQSGSINFKYTEGNRKIELDEVMPMTDVQGKAQDDYFEFTIDAKTSRTVDIPYDITIRKATGENILPDNIIKVYLTKVENNTETQVLLNTVDQLNGYTNLKINIPATEKLLYTSRVLAGDTNYSVTYRLRMWIDTSANYITQTPTEAYCEDTSTTPSTTVTEIGGVAATEANCVGDNYVWHKADTASTYPLNGKSYSLTVNVYGEGNDIGESGVATRQNTNIESISLDNSNLTLENGVYTGEAIMPEGETTMTKTIVVETENPNATVTAEKVESPTSMNIEKSKTKKLSTSVQLENLTVGENNYIITVRGEDNRTTHQFNLSITVEPANAFRDDSWATIQYNVTHGNVNRYHVGDTRPISIEISGSTILTNLRVANITSCEDALKENPNLTSESACGFVVEFENSFGMIWMNSYDIRNTNVGGYPGTTEMYNYVTNIVYNALPSELRAVMQDTIVVSSHGNGSDATCDTTLSTRDANCNYVTIEKLYLFDINEVVGLDELDSTKNTAINTTRQLDFYANGGRKTKDCRRCGNPHQEWWSRTAYGKDSNRYLFIASAGNGVGYSDAYESYVSSIFVSPAFRIG